MGTSNIFNGNNDRNPLLPSDYEENGKNESTVTWQTVKTDMSKYITSGGSKGSARHIVQQYVRASGGSGKMMSASSAGLRTANRIGSMFYKINSSGVEKTLYDLGIQFQGKNVSEIFSRLLDVLSPDANTKEDGAARKAAQETLAELYDYVESNDMDIHSLEKMPIVLMDKALCLYIGTYIWNMMMKDLESRFEKYMEDPIKSYQMECEFKEIIMSVVEIEYKKKGSIVNKDVNNAISELSLKCIKVLEGVG